MPSEIGDIAPDFTLRSHLSQKNKVRLSDFRGKQNVVLHVLVSAFTRGWAHQVSEFQLRNSRLKEKGAQVLGMSVDGDPVLRAFATSLGGVRYPLLSDFHPKGSVCESYGIYNEGEGRAKRAVFIIDKKGVIRFKKIYNRGLPNTEEVLAELDKLESKG